MNPFTQLFTNNMGTKAIAVVIAIVLWFVVLASKKETATKDIPIEVITSEKTIPANEIPRSVVVKLRGPKAFLRTVIDRPENPIKVNLVNRKPGLVTYRFFAHNISRLPIGVDALSFNPPSLVVQLDELAKKRVPVRAQLQGVPPEGFQIVKTKLEPPRVRLIGARSRIKKVTEILTVPIDVSELRANREEVARLELPPVGYRLEGEPPKVKIEVAAVSPNYKIRNVKINVISGHRSRLKTKTVTVYVRATPDQLRDLDQTKVFAEVNLNQKAKGTHTGKVTVKVPEGIGVVKTEPMRVKVTLY